MAKIVTDGDTLDFGFDLGALPANLLSKTLRVGCRGLFLFGTDMPKQVPELISGVASVDRERGDFSGRTRAPSMRKNLLAKIGTTTLDTNFVPLSLAGGSYSMQETVDQIAALNGKVTIATVDQYPNVNAASVASYNGTAQNGVMIGRSGGTNYSMTCRKADLSGFATATVAINSYTGFEYLVGTYEVGGLHLYCPRQSLTGSNVAQNFVVGGSNLLRLGTALGTFTAVNNLSMAGVWDRALSATEANVELYGLWKAFLAALTHPVSI